jgi:hypothetical protein
MILEIPALLAQAQMHHAFPVLLSTTLPEK